jgi:hypothetical protein
MVSRLLRSLGPPKNEGLATPLLLLYTCAIFSNICDSLHSFYEWQEVKGGGQKQPYFIYFKEKIKHDENNEEDEMKSDRPLLTMAGIFDVWQPSSVQSFLNLVLIH